MTAKTAKNSSKTVLRKGNGEMTEAQIKQTAQEEARKALLNVTISDEDLTTEDDESTFFGRPKSDTDIMNELEKEIEEDIFLIGKRMIIGGASISYRIYRNGEMLGRVDADPEYAWEDVQNIFASAHGKGAYKVQLINNNKGTIVKTQTKTLQIPMGKNTVHSESSGEDTANLVKELIRQQQEQREAFERRLDETEKKYKEEIRYREEKATSGSTNNLSTMAELLKVLKPEPKNDNNMVEIILKLNETQTKAQEKIADNMYHLIEKMNDKFERTISKITEKLENKKPEVSWEEIQEKIEKARREAREDERHINRLIEAKAEERAEILSAQGGSDKEESTTDTLIKAVIPMIATAYAQNKNVPTGMPQAMLPPQPRRSLPENRNPKQFNHQRAIAVPRAEERNQAKTTTNPTGQQKSGSALSKNNLGLPTIKTKPVVPLEQNEIEVTIEPNINDAQLKEKIGEAVFPILLDSVQTKKGYDATADECWEALKIKGLANKKIVELYPLPELLALADSLSIESSWTEGFYANLKNKTTLATRQSAN